MHFPWKNRFTTEGVSLDFKLLLEEQVEAIIRIAAAGVPVAVFSGAEALATTIYVLLGRLVQPALQETAIKDKSEVDWYKIQLQALE